MGIKFSMCFILSQLIPSSSGEGLVARLVESGKGLDLTVFEGVLFSVSQSVKELSVLASFDDAVLVPIGRHEEALSHGFAGSEVSNRGDLSGSTRIDRSH